MSAVFVGAAPVGIRTGIVSPVATLRRAEVRRMAWGKLIRIDVGAVVKTAPSAMLVVTRMLAPSCFMPGIPPMPDDWPAPRVGAEAAAVPIVKLVLGAMA